MTDNYLLKTAEAREIYSKIKDLPIVDYHCHLSPKEIFEDKPFNNIGEMWLGGDHYKWRLMRTAGIDERYITGDTDWREKFIKYAAALELAAGNPLYHWSHMELSMFFGIDKPLKSDNAAEIYDGANAFIAENRLSPRKLIEQSKVETLCTTDDIIDTLEYHKKIREDKSFKTRVLPSFRTDNLLLMRRAGYPDYIKKLAEVSGTEITDLESLKAAVIKRLDFFCLNGCRFTDVGIPYFPDRIADDASADGTFKKALAGAEISDTEYSGFIGNMYLFLAAEYKKRNLVMQMHLAVYRNANSNLFAALGADCGVDCVGDKISGTALIHMLDAINKTGGMPQTIIYTLNPSNAAQIASVAGAFPNVRCGAAWWFCDHKRGIREEMEIIAENSALGSFLGMLTDSRSFLSYARHDYFRRIAADILGEWVNGGEYDKESAVRLAEKISYYNIKEQAEENGLIFDIVESVPVPEEIKLGTEKAEEYTEVYCENIRRCAKYGVKCITYNFVPVFDWTRTQLDKEAADGSTSLVMYMDQLKSLDPLKDDIHLPGWDASYTQAEVRDLIKAYSALGEEGLWRNLEKFLKRIIPVAEDCGVTMAIHPDDPPYPIFGIPRIITNERNIDRMLNIVDSPANSLCFCTGSLGCAAFNDIPKMVRKYSEMGRIAFMHIRQVKLLEDGSFEERGHLSKDGSLDMYEIVKALVDTGFDGYVRPDHGRMIWGESGKPGYGLFDRALGAAYINGLFEAVEKEKK